MHTGFACAGDREPARVPETPRERCVPFSKEGCMRKPYVASAPRLRKSLKKKADFAPPALRERECAGSSE